MRNGNPSWLTWFTSFCLMLTVLQWPGPSHGFLISADTEKPDPEFTREGEIISAKLIPRAKNSSVVIRFQAQGGRLAEVFAVDFSSADRPEVDVKNFKSALFGIRVEDVPTGGDVGVSVISDFFSGGTQFFVFNERLEQPWSKDVSRNIGHPERVRELIVEARDGGPLDSDGAEDGRITLVGGPRDSFWGYALGTLAIRFVGIFIVLCFLMIGILISGRVFRTLEARAKDAKAKATSTHGAEVADLPKEPASSDETPGEVAAAIAMALKLHRGAGRMAGTATATAAANSWTMSGRGRIMDERSLMFNRGYRGRQ
jgi:Na+-transporting methylmalonyl-CoA/oxaloacetate decarboxylase gamma subunit